MSSGCYLVLHSWAPVATGRRTDTLLPLPAVAEPHPHHLLLQAEAVGDAGDVERGGFRLSEEVTLERVLGTDADRCPSLPTSLGGVLLLAMRCPCLLGLLKPLLQDGLQLLGILEAQLEIFEPAYGRLAEVGALDLGQSLSDVGLRVAELDASLLEAGSEFFQLLHLGGVRVGGLRLRDGARRALDDGLVGHGRDGRADLHGRNQRRGSTQTTRSGLDEGGWKHMNGAGAAVGMDGEGDASEGRRLQVHRRSRSQNCLHGQSRYVRGCTVVVDCGADYCSSDVSVQWHFRTHGGVARRRAAGSVRTLHRHAGHRGAL